MLNGECLEHNHRSWEKTDARTTEFNEMMRLKTAGEDALSVQSRLQSFCAAGGPKLVQQLFNTWLDKGVYLVMLV